MVGADAVIDGPIKLEEGLIVYGKINGNVETKGPVRIAKGAIIVGSVKGTDIRLGGSVSGDVYAEGKVILGKNCILKGDITYRSILIEEGAQFKGKADILNEKK
tara:strand:- start:1524 stop:1835 length:312 start_codon:yes stop_codon:yes gene_type:complete